MKNHVLKRISAVLLAVALSTSLVACGSSSSSSSDDSEETSEEETVEEEEEAVEEEAEEAEEAEETEEAEDTSTSGDTQTLNVRATSFGNNYDVQDMGWRWMMAACYSGLYRNVADEDGEHFILDGAESVDVSDDETVYTFHLREDAYWSDGVPVTAYDYEYGWKRLLNPEYLYDYASFLFNVVGAEEYYNGEGSADDVMCVALDDYTFEVTLKVADSTFLSKLVATPTYPTREDLAEAAGDAWGTDWTLCVYNGPFCMSELVEDSRMVWTKNEYYWDADSVSLETINWYLVAEDSTAATMFDNGELDILQTSSSDYAALYESEAEAGDIQVINADYPGTVVLSYDHLNGGASGLMGNAKIRLALSLAINREELLEAIYGGQGVAAYGYVSPAITFDGTSYRSLVEEPLKAVYDEYAGDSEALTALFQEGLDELGVDTALSDITITFLSYGSSTSDAGLREYLQQIWAGTFGINVELNTVGDYSLFTAERDAGNYDIMTGGWYSDYNDPLDYLYTMYTGIYSSYGSYSNEEYDALIDSLTGETDLDTRLAIYEEAENILFEDSAIIPLYYSIKQYFVQNWVKDFRWSSFGASQEFYITYIEGRGN